MAHVHAEFPEIIIVPSHDARAAAEIPAFRRGAAEPPVVR
jgi:hypothetical protein